jgi:mono/diheme cytochrome c family protein
VLKPMYVLLTLFLSASPPQQPAAPATPAAMPADAATLVNPVKPTAASQAQSKKMYGYDCATCHGDTGDGKGDLAADLKMTLPDFTDPAALKGVPDGEIFYVIKNGKGKMMGEGDRLKPDDLWNMVIYVRSMAKK